MAGRPALPARRLLRLRPPAPESFPGATLAVGRWEPELGEYVLDWREAGVAADPEAAVLAFAASAFRHACEVCDWDPALAASIDTAPIIR